MNREAQGWTSHREKQGNVGKGNLPLSYAGSPPLSVLGSMQSNINCINSIQLHQTGHLPFAVPSLDALCDAVLNPTVMLKMLSYLS